MASFSQLSSHCHPPGPFSLAPWLPGPGPGTRQATTSMHGRVRRVLKIWAGHKTDGATLHGWVRGVLEIWAGRKTDGATMHGWVHGVLWAGPTIDGATMLGTGGLRMLGVGLRHARGHGSARSPPRYGVYGHGEKKKTVVQWRSVWRWSSLRRWKSLRRWSSLRQWWGSLRQGGRPCRRQWGSLRQWALARVLLGRCQVRLQHHLQMEQQSSPRHLRVRRFWWPRPAICKRQGRKACLRRSLHKG